MDQRHQPEEQRTEVDERGGEPAQRVSGKRKERVGEKVAM